MFVVLIIFKFMIYSLFIFDLYLDLVCLEYLVVLEILFDNYVGKVDCFYVLGDLFEVWIGDDDDSFFNWQVIDVFWCFFDVGFELFFMYGNWDFLFGDQFVDDCGGVLLDEGIVVDLYGICVLLMYGDSLCIEDYVYQ